MLENYGISLEEFQEILEDESKLVINDAKVTLSTAVPVTWSNALTEKSSSDFENAEKTACDAIREGSNDIKQCTVSEFTKDNGSRKKRSADVIAAFELLIYTIRDNALEILQDFESNFNGTAFQAAGGGTLDDVVASIVPSSEKDDPSSSTNIFASLLLSLFLYLSW